VSVLTADSSERRPHHKYALNGEWDFVYTFHHDKIPVGFEVMVQFY
jgi:hypothetical protein